MGKRFLFYPWRNMICDDCKARGFGPEIYLFYSHWWGTEDNHICPPLTKEEIRKLLQEECKRRQSPVFFENGMGL